MERSPQDSVRVNPQLQQTSGGEGPQPEPLQEQLPMEGPLLNPLQRDERLQPTSGKEDPSAVSGTLCVEPFSIEGLRVNPELQCPHAYSVIAVATAAAKGSVETEAAARAVAATEASARVAAKEAAETEAAGRAAARAAAKEAAARAVPETAVAMGTAMVVPFPMGSHVSGATAEVAWAAAATEVAVTAAAMGSAMVVAPLPVGSHVSARYLASSRGAMWDTWMDGLVAGFTFTPGFAPLYSIEYFDGDQEEVQLIFIYVYTYICIYIGIDIGTFYYISASIASLLD